MDPHSPKISIKGLLKGLAHILRYGFSVSLLLSNRSFYLGG